MTSSETALRKTVHRKRDIGRARPCRVQLLRSSRRCITSVLVVTRCSLAVRCSIGRPSFSCVAFLRRLRAHRSLDATLRRFAN